MSASALRSAGPESVCPNCLMPGARPGERCSGCRLRLELDTCGIEAWRGHETCAFVARRSDGTLVAVSPAFRSDDCEQPAETPATVSARDELLAMLDGQGWRRGKRSRRGPWYATQLERLVALDGPEFVVPPTEALAAAAVPARAGTLVPAAEAPRRHAGKLISAISVAGLIVAGVLAYAVLARGTHHRTRLVTVPPKAQAKTTAPSAPATAAKPAPARKVRLAVTATRTSWLELRRGSRTGRVLYSGELPAGHSLHVSAPRIWARFGAAANLDIVVDGTRIPLQGTLERVFTKT